MQDPIWNAIDLKKKDDHQNIINILSQVPIFSELSDRQLKEVAKIVYRREYQQTEPIFRMGDPGLGMYIIITGRVEIVDDSDEQSRRLAILDEGAFFGDLALLDESPRSASALALESCEIIGFFRPDLLDMLQRKPKLGIKILFNLAKVVGERLRQTNAQLTELQEKLKAMQNG